MWAAAGREARLPGASVLGAEPRASRVPIGSPSADLTGELLAQWPNCAAFIVSFLRALEVSGLPGPAFHAVAFAGAFVSAPLRMTRYDLLILYFGISGRRTLLTCRLAAWWRRGPPQGPSRNATSD
jgi:hypothetical protein